MEYHMQQLPGPIEMSQWLQEDDAFLQLQGSGIQLSQSDLADLDKCFEIGYNHGLDISANAPYVQPQPAYPVLEGAAGRHDHPWLANDLDHLRDDDINVGQLQLNEGLPEIQPHLLPPPEPVVSDQGPELIDAPVFVICAGRCAGNIVGAHRCLWNDRRLDISCHSCSPHKLFRRKSDYTRHYRNVHLQTSYPCPFPGCSRMFTRADNVIPHRRATHGEIIRERHAPPPGSRARRARREAEVAAEVDVE